ncbi:uncharacterized protein LOC101459195 [Ceratitis capitata]|uniref:(Mediterranean fruit fly) hypothetical protein n=1 Tax=Ceratitis capitata TaxID=7213 RepID=A0A811U1T0_CERCA|nr:uncharacterized protein LOC101459195 [Ceratitis capitata]CAD6991215.1 unnamed protein product [Ceratitis capitata]
MSQYLAKELNGEKATHLKICIETIRANIEKLEKFANDNCDGLHLDSLKQQTDKLLHFAEQAPLEKIAKLLQRNKLKRLKKKAKLKIIKSNLKLRNKSMNLTASTKSNIIHNSEIPSKPSTYKALINYQAESLQPKLHKRLLKRHDAQRFLETFELLKTLHISREQNAENTKKFTEQLKNLRFSWSKILEENESECAQEQHVEDQWNEIFFGVDLRPHHCTEQKMADFLRIRRIWDSFITRSKHGTFIPCGWVLPPENPAIEWVPYRTSN